MSSADGPQSSPPRTDWSKLLTLAVGQLSFGLVTNWLSNALHPLGYGGVLVFVAVVVVGIVRLDKTAPIAKVLPRVLLCLTVAGVALAVAIPASWTGPIAVASVMLALCAATAARDRAAAFTSLAGISLFTAGLLMVSESVRAQGTAGKVITIVLGCYAVLLGLLCLLFRRVLFGSRGITTATLRNSTMAWSRASALGILTVPLSIQLGAGGHLLAAILVAIAGLSWLVVTMVFVFTKGRDTLAGAMLSVSGAAVTGLGLVAFYSQEFLGGTIAITAGVAMTGGGLSMLDSTGALLRLANLFKPQPPA